MPTVSVSFRQRESDLLEAARFDVRHGPWRRYTLLSPLTLSVFLFAGLVCVFQGWPGLFAVLLSVGLGAFTLIGNWYVLPHMMLAWVTDWRELNHMVPDRIVVSLSEDGILWVAAGSNTVIPWEIVRSTSLLDCAVCIHAGRPLTTLWIPSRAFASPGAAESFAKIAQIYGGQVSASAPNLIGWPQTPQQRRTALVFMIVWTASFGLPMLLLWLLRG